MSIRNLLLGVACGLVALGLNARGFAQDRPTLSAGQKPSTSVGDLKFSGPCIQENLTIFLILGEDRIKGRDFLTLQEAIEQKKIVVHETANVNELAVENISPSQEIFVQSGDLVKGGKQ